MNEAKERYKESLRNFSALDHFPRGGKSIYDEELEQKVLEIQKKLDSISQKLDDIIEYLKVNFPEEDF